MERRIKASKWTLYQPSICGSYPVEEIFGSLDELLYYLFDCEENIESIEASRFPDFSVWLIHTNNKDFTASSSPA